MSMLHGFIVGVVAIFMAFGVYWWGEIRRPKPLHWIKNVDQQTTERRLKLASMQHGAVKGFEAHRSDRAPR